MALIDGIDLGQLTNFLFFFQSGRDDANWQGATKGFVGDVAVNGLVAALRTSGDVPYAGTLITNAPTQGAWQAILDQNPTQAVGVTDAVVVINDLTNNLTSAFQQINALPATPGFESVSALSLDGLNTQNGVNETFVINVTSGFQVSSEINITGDPGDVYILRWDEDANFANGYQGIVKFQSGGAIVPHGGLTPTNFINVAGDINSSGGGTTPPPPYPQGPRYDNGQGSLIIGGSDFSGGGFFTGYWLTTGAPTEPGPGGLIVGPTQPLSNGIFVGGWYTLTTQFSMTSGTSGVYVSPNPATVPQPAITLIKQVSPDNGATFFDADVPPGPTVIQGTNPVFRYIITNTGNVTLSNVTLTDDVYGSIALPTTTLIPGETITVDVTEPWAAGQHTNVGTVTGQYGTQTATASNPANYFGAAAPVPTITIIKQVSPDNGVTFYDADVPPGPNVPQGTNPVFRYIITNTGNVTLTNVTLTDDVYGNIVLPTTTLAPGESITVTTTQPWAVGLHTNIGTVTGQFEGTTVTASNPANYTGVAAPVPTITIVKQVSPDNGVTFYDADVPPGPNVPQGTNPIFRYIITNTGNVTLTNVTLTDNVYGNVVLPTTTLAPGETITVTTTQPWAVGLHTNIGTVTGQFEGTIVTASNPANYTGVAAPVPTITIIKQVSPDNGATFYDADTPPGPSIPQGTNPVYRYIITNTGNVTLTNVTLTDDVYGNIVLPVTTLAPGESITVTATQPWAVGLHTNIGTTTGQFEGTTVTASNPANYTGVAAPVPTITIIKQVSPDNGATFYDADVPPGPSIPQGTNPVYRYIITNIGNVTLTNVTLTDDVYGNIVLPTTTLAPGESITVTTTQPWAAGLHTNIGTTTGQFEGTTVTASNPANYTGVAAPVPTITIIKQVSPDNGATFYDADVPPGPNVPQGTNPVYRYIITNTGNVTLTNVALTDDVYGNIVLPTTTLAPGESITVTTTQPWAVGLHTNIGTTTGQFEGTTVTASNPANYTGTAAPVPTITIVKQVSPDNGVTFFDADVPPGPNVPQGTNPIFRYIITNTGNVTLTNVTLTDDVYGNIILPTTTLAPGESVTVTTTQPWAAGLHTNIGTATGEYNGVPVTASNPANYTGLSAPIPTITIVKQVSPDNGMTFFDADVPPGPNVPQGTNPLFRYIITNTGNVTITNVTLTDDVYGNIVLPTTTLAPGESVTVTTTQPWAAGLHTNIGTVTGQFEGQTLTASNPANYTGTAAPAPTITIIKQVSPDNGTTFFDADVPPGPNVPQGTNPIFRYIVTNTGNVTLSNVTLTDNVLGNITVPTTTLVPGQSFTIERVGTFAAGQQMNLATATGQFEGQTATANNPANYFGVLTPVPTITIRKLVSVNNGITFEEADVAPGPNLPQGTNPIFRFIVTNTGNTTLNNVTLIDTSLGTITVPTTTLAPGQSFTIERAGTFQSGQHTNVATTTGQFEGQTVTANNPANFFGVVTPAPVITVRKLVSVNNGVTFEEANVAPGPNLPQGTNPIFRLIVTNTGNVALTNVTLTDTTLGNITIPTTNLAPGESFTVTLPGTFQAGQHTNLATVTGRYGTTTVTGNNPANFFGVVTPAPTIAVRKLVSVNNGLTFEEANTAPGPNLPQGTNPIFRFIVTNTGNVALTNVNLIDTALGTINVPTTNLAPGESFTLERTGTFQQGQHTNLATAAGRYGTTTVTGTNPANFFGVVPPAPAITVRKLVSVDNGVTFVEADMAPGPNLPQGTNPIFRFIVTNTGNTTLTNVTLNDTTLGNITIPTTTLAPGQSFTIERVGTFQSGQHTNTATTTGQFEGQTVTSSNSANYLGLSARTMFKQLSIEENVSIPHQKPNAEEIIDTNVTVVITNTHVIKTARGTSLEGQTLTGWKLVVEGRLVQSVVYIADEPTQSVHAAEFNVPFSTFVILPEDFKQNTPLQVNGYIEDVFVKLIDCRRIFKNITLRIEAKSKC